MERATGKPTISSFRDLRVWHLAMDMVDVVYQLTQGFPRSEIYGLTSQMRRSAVSIPSNIAEGHTREHTKEYLHHISTAQGSLAELETQLEIASRLGYLPAEHLKQTLGQAASLGRQLFALRNALDRSLLCRDGDAEVYEYGNGASSPGPHPEVGAAFEIS